MDPIKRPRHDMLQSGSQYVQLRGNGNQNNQKSALQTDAFPFATMLQSDSLEQKQVRDRVNEILGGNQDASIPSPLPATLNRRDLPLFKTNAQNYQVCEKSDGERALMYVNNTGCYLINRKFQIQRINDDTFGLYSNIATVPTSEPAQLAPKSHEFLLDGEIILNYFNPEEDHFKTKEEAQQTTIPFSLKTAMDSAGNVDTYLASCFTQQRYVYCMFDCAYYENKSIQSSPLLSRLDYCNKVKQRVKSYIIPKIREQFPVQDNPALVTEQDCYEAYIWKHAALRFETKEFQKATDMRRIIRTIYCFKGEKGYIYVNPGKKLKAKNDGFIFTPEQNDYMMKANAELSLFKYKWPGLNTVDFHIISPYFDEQQKLMLFSHGYDGSGQAQRKVDFEFARVSLSQEERDFVLSRVDKVDKAVVECNYDRHRGNWVIKHLRTDKHKGNFFSTVLSCMEAMIDNLKPDELEQRLRQ